MIIIVLVKPRNPNNIGAAARAMVNFGFSGLRFVDVHTPNLDEAVSAVGAQDVLKNAKTFNSLPAALADCNFAFATTSLKKRSVKQRVVKLPEIKEFMSTGESKGKIAIVFGSEKTGLGTDDIALCDAVLNIPAALAQPSINLAQAVNLVCYEFSKLNSFKQSTAAPSEMPDKRETEIVVGEIATFLNQIHFKTELTDKDKQALVRDMLSRAAFKKDQLFMLKKLLSKIGSSLKP